MTDDGKDSKLLGEFIVLQVLLVTINNLKDFFFPFSKITRVIVTKFDTSRLRGIALTHATVNQ